MSAGRGKLVGGEDAFDARHRQRLARVDALHAAVRQRAEQQLAEQHAVDAEVFGVLGLAGDLGDKVRRDVVLADEFVCHGVSLAAARRRASAP